MIYYSSGGKYKEDERIEYKKYIDIGIDGCKECPYYLKGKFCTYYKRKIDVDLPEWCEF